MQCHITNENWLCLCIFFVYVGVQFVLMVKKSKNIVAILNYIFAHASTEVCARQLRGRFRIMQHPRQAHVSIYSHSNQQIYSIWANLRFWGKRIKVWHCTLGEAIFPVMIYHRQAPWSILPFAVTFFGLYWFCVLPMPSCPLLLDPQHHKPPSLFRAQVWAPPVARKMARNAPPAEVCWSQRSQ